MAASLSFSSGAESLGQFRCNAEPANSLELSLQSEVVATISREGVFSVSVDATDANTKKVLQLLELMVQRRITAIRTTVSGSGVTVEPDTDSKVRMRDLFLLLHEKAAMAGVCDGDLWDTLRKQLELGGVIE